MTIAKHIHMRMTLMLSAKAHGAVAAKKTSDSMSPRRERVYMLGQSYRAEEARQLYTEASYRSIQKVGLLERSISNTKCGWT